MILRLQISAWAAPQKVAAAISVIKVFIKLPPLSMNQRMLRPLKRTLREGRVGMATRACGEYARPWHPASCKIVRPPKGARESKVPGEPRSVTSSARQEPRPSKMLKFIFPAHVTLQANPSHPSAIPD